MLFSWVSLSLLKIPRAQVFQDTNCGSPVRSASFHRMPDTRRGSRLGKFHRILLKSPTPPISGTGWVSQREYTVNFGCGEVSSVEYVILDSLNWALCDTLYGYSR